MSDSTNFDEKNMGTNPETEDEQQFIKEKIVNKRKKKRFRRLITFLFVVLCGCAFGVVARYAFLVSGDYLVEHFGIDIPEYRQTVSVYKEDPPTPTPTPTRTPTPTPRSTPTKSVASYTPKPTAQVSPVSTAAPTQFAKVTDTPIEMPTVTPTQEPVLTTTPETEVTPGPEPTGDADVSPTPDPDEKPSVTVDDGNEAAKEKTPYSYSKFMSEVMEVAQTVDDCIVSVSGIRTGTGFLKEEYEIRSNTTGLLLQQDGVDLLILTDFASIEDASYIEVSFNGSEKAFSGDLYSYDKELGLAIVGVPIVLLDEGMFDNMKYAVLCKEDDIENGLPVFELGRANGFPDSLSFGVVSSRGNLYEVKDGVINYFTTNWQNYVGASGFVFNMEGKVLGMLTHSLKADEENSIPCFVTLYTLEDEINILLNGGSLIHIGIYANNLPQMIKDVSNVENGIYLNRVIAGSPAYMAGLRVGDIITDINGIKLMNMYVFMDVLTDSSSAQTLNVNYVRRISGETKKMSTNVALNGK